jgi:hypothetical protein
MRLSARLTISALALTLGVLTSGANAETVISQTYSGSFPASISGTLANEDTVLEESFTLTGATNFTAFTTSYATGGFQPNLTLYSSSGISVANQSATYPPGAMADPATGQIEDGYLSATNLAAGRYTLTLTDWELQQDPSATNLSDGFKFNLGNGSAFVDSQGNTRTGAYTLSVDATSAGSAMPEPATLALLGPLFVAAWFARKRLRPIAQ